jgi:hypothetical protein
MVSESIQLIVPQLHPHKPPLPLKQRKRISVVVKMSRAPTGQS